MMSRKLINYSILQNERFIGKCIKSKNYNIYFFQKYPVWVKHGSRTKFRRSSERRFCLRKMKKSTNNFKKVMGQRVKTWVGKQLLEQKENP